MKIGTILGALSPGLSATGLFGHSAQEGGLGALSAMSPLLALLLMHKKKKDNYAQQDAAPPAAMPPQIPGAPGMPGMNGPGLMPYIGPRP
jgi:hypothetical protein